MTRRSLTLLAISGLVLVLVVPLSAQTMRFKANIPFEFVAGTRTLPAGDYVIDTTPAQSVVRVWNENTHDSFAILSNSVSEPFVSSNPEAKLIFHRYGNQYFLSQVWDGYNDVGRKIPMGNSERALSAMSRTPATLVLLARR